MEYLIIIIITYSLNFIASGDDTKKKRRKGRKETYSSYIYKGKHLFTQLRSPCIEFETYEMQLV